MIFKNSLSITGNKFTLIYKVLLYMLIAVLIFSAVAVAFLLPTLKIIFSEISDMHIIKNIGQYVTKILNGEVGDGDFAHITQLFNRLAAIFTDNYNRLVLAFVFIVILYFIFMFLASMCYYSVSDIVNSFMSSASSYPFMSNFVHNFKKSARFALLFTLINIPIRILFALIVIGLTLLCSLANYLLAAIVCYLTTLITLALSNTMFCSWMPSMIVHNTGVVQGLKSNFRNKKSFGYMLGVYFAYELFMSAIIIPVSLFTLGVGGIMLIAASIVIRKTMDLVLYYHDNNLKYYRDRNKVVNPTHRFAESVYDPAIQSDLESEENNDK
ncbi:MAG: hypothetical protein K2I79_04325 [Clostridia bacterium]|nr:hypothetical protein [Clostridia bacterium]